MLAHAHDGANVGSTGRRHEIGNSTSEASKQARGEFLLFPHDVRGGKHYSSFFGQEVRPGQDQVLCLLFKETQPEVYPIQMLREFACHLPVQRHLGLSSAMRDYVIREAFASGPSLRD